MKKGSTEEDPFWEIALCRDVSGCKSSDVDEADDEADDNDDNDPDDNTDGHSCGDDEHHCDGEELEAVVASRAVCYRLPAMTNIDHKHKKHQTYGPVTFRLSGLQSTGSLSSPLGAQAWYGSALLAALLWNNPPPPWLAEVLRHTHTALELGSGAVGLVASTLAWVLAQECHNSSSSSSRSSSKQRRKNEPTPFKVIATDHDSAVLEQLQVNLKSTQNQLSREFPDESSIPHLQVLSLDWNDDFSPVASLDVVDNLQLVVGSELVYTNSTAHACANIVRRLLLEHPHALIVMVQVTDRQGWDEVFLPTLRENSNHPPLRVHVEPVEAHIHDLASHLIPMGGTLDRFDFEICRISRADVTYPD